MIGPASTWPPPLTKLTLTVLSVMVSNRASAPLESRYWAGKLSDPRFRSAQVRVSLSDQVSPSTAVGRPCPSLVARTPTACDVLSAWIPTPSSANLLSRSVSKEPRAILSPAAVEAAMTKF